MPDNNQLSPESMSITEDKLNRLKEILPEAFAEDKIDFTRLKQALGEEVFVKDEHYELTWAGKTDVFKVLQQPTTATLAPCKEESVNFNDTENIFIEGENLEVLKILQRSYFGKIKMIYIDPPYNTGNDSFIYPDKFAESKEDYLKRINEKDEEGYLTKDGYFRKNSKDGGHYHSNWLTMMYPRLYLARNLLKEDGVIFVSIDENEQHRLRIILDEIFGEENFIGEFIWKNKHGGGGDSPHLVKEHEHIFFYCKNFTELPELFARPPEHYEKMFREEDERGKFYYDRLDKKGIDSNRPNLVYPIECPDGTLKDISPNIWRLSKEEFERRKEENEVGFKKDKNGNWQIYTKTYLFDENGIKRKVKSRSILKQGLVGFTQNGNREIEEIFNVRLFPNPKPISLILYLIDMIISRNSGDIILDFFSGSGTLAHSVMELNKEDNGNRKYICMQLPEKTDEDSEAFKAGYETIAEIGKERIRRVIKKIEEEKAEKPSLFEDKQLDLGFRVFKLKHSNFKLWRGDYIDTEEDLQNQIEAFEDPVMKGAKEINMLYELMIKTGYVLSDKVEEKEGYYSVCGNELIVILSEVKQETLDEIIGLAPKHIIALDAVFENNDQLKTNTALQMKDAGIRFTTV